MQHSTWAHVGVEQAKLALRNRIVGTLRGGAVETLQRGAIEEAQASPASALLIPHSKMLATSSLAFIKCDCCKMVVRRASCGA